MKRELLSPERLAWSLSTKDLTVESNGPNKKPHAMFLVVRKIIDALALKSSWPEPDVWRLDPRTTIANNFDILQFPLDNEGRSSEHTRYISETKILRTHTSAIIPPYLRHLSTQIITDHVVATPGIVFRRDQVDRTHAGEFHQMDVWRIKAGLPRLTDNNLVELIETILYSVLPGAQYRINDSPHPYTHNGKEVEALLPDGSWMEILECGLAHPMVLKKCGIDPEIHSGLALGMGLDRLVMMLKGIPDIRILRSENPRISAQMNTLEPYVEVSKYPGIENQSMSLTVNSELPNDEVLTRIAEAAGRNADLLEDIRITDSVPYQELLKIAPKAVERLGMEPGQKNVVLKFTLRSIDKTLEHEEANSIYRKIYTTVHEGSRGYVQ